MVDYRSMFDLQGKNALVDGGAAAASPIEWNPEEA